MTSPYTWRDAYRTLNSLGPAERKVLPLLAWLPLAAPPVLEPLLDLGRSRTCECLAALREAGVVGTICVPTINGRPKELSYLTDLGLAVLSIVEDEDPRTLARLLRVTGPDLVRLEPQLPHVLSLYELLGLIARTLAPCELLFWERPWHRRFEPVGGLSPATAAVPAYAALATVDGGSAEYLLLPDRGLVPVAAYRSMTAALFRWRAVNDGHLPALIVAVSSRQRADAWAGMLEDVRCRLGEAGLAGSVATWSELAGGNGRLPQIPIVSLPTLGGESGCFAGPLEVSRQPRRHLPAPVAGDISSSAEQTSGEGLCLVSSSDLSVLELIGCHAFLDEGEVATLQEWKDCTAAATCKRLVASGLVARITFPRPAANGGIETLASAGTRTKCDRMGGLELTRTGLNVLASNHGLPTHVVAKALGLAASGGPVKPKKRPDRMRRDQLLRHLDHTRAVNRLHVRFVQAARQRRDHGWDDAVVDWKPAAVCGGPLIRPDAYLVYHREGVSWGAFVEIDRGTERGREYRRKFRGYWEYHDSGAYQSDYDGFPHILVITADKEAEDRIIRVLDGMGLGRSGLPVLVTNEERVSLDPVGLLGLVWRSAEDGFSERHAWPPRS